MTTKAGLGVSRGLAVWEKPMNYLPAMRPGWEDHVFGKIVTGYAAVALGAAFLGAMMLGPGEALAQSPAPLAAERFVDPVSAYSAEISPSGAYVAYISRTGESRQLIVADLASRSGKVLQTIDDSLGSIDWVDWKSDNRLILGVRAHQKTGSDAPTGSLIGAKKQSYDIYRVFALNRDGGKVVQMFQGQQNRLGYGRGSTFLQDRLPNDPEHDLIKAWDNTGVGVYRGDVTTGHVERIASGSDDTLSFETDGNGVPVLRTDQMSDGSGYRIFRRAPDASTWTFYLQARRAETATNSPDFQPLGPGPGPAQVYVSVRKPDSDLLRLYLFNTATGELDAPPTAPGVVDIQGVWLSPKTYQITATCEYGVRYKCNARDPDVQKNLAAIDRFVGGAADITLVNMSDDSTKWLLTATGPTLPTSFFVYDVASHSVAPVASVYPGMDTAVLSPTDIVSYKARDGTELWAYVTAARAAPGPRPTVVMPHGGPESRDYFGYDAYVQFLASRGYVVVQPNFRGGAGFGRAFADAGRGQWGLRMQDDVTDAVRHMIDAGVADPKRVCIVGASYGGYVALQGVAATPDLYRCAVSIAGVSDLMESLLIEGQQGRQRMNYQYWLRSMGDPQSNRAALEATSPRRHADKITAPVLLIHGEEDDNVPIAQSRGMKKALDSARHETRLVQIPGEGHYLDEWSRENRLTLYRETETFLAQNLKP